MVFRFRNVSTEPGKEGTFIDLARVVVRSSRARDVPICACVSAYSSMLLFTSAADETPSASGSWTQLGT